MHILGGKGGVHMLLRGYDDEHPNRGQWELYMERSGIGTAPYRASIARSPKPPSTGSAATRKRQKSPGSSSSPTPARTRPSASPSAFFELQDEASVSLPRHYAPGQRSSIPASRIFVASWAPSDITDEAALRRITAGYLGLVAHLDEQMGQVLRELDEQRLAESTAGPLHERPRRPFWRARYPRQKLHVRRLDRRSSSFRRRRNPGRPRRRPHREPRRPSRVCDAVGAELAPEDSSLPGRSLLAPPDPAAADRPGFAEYHATGSASGVFMFRERSRKLVHYVGMPSQLFDLGSDPDEARDLVADGTGTAEAARLERQLKKICDHKAVDARAKADQRAMTEKWGGREAVAPEGSLVFTPPPGEAAEIER